MKKTQQAAARIDFIATKLQIYKLHFV